MCVWGEAKSNFHLAVTPNTLQVKCDERLLLRPIAARRCSLWRSRVCEVETLQWKIVALKVEVKDRQTEINFESRGSPWGLALSEGSVEQCNQRCLSTATLHPNISLTNGDSRPPDFLPLPRLASGACPLLTGPQLPVSRTLMTHTVVQQAAWSHCLTLTSNAKLRTVMQYSPPHPRNKTSYSIFS